MGITLKVGRNYRTRGGWVAMVTERLEGGALYDAKVYSLKGPTIVRVPYVCDGEAFGVESHLDIVSEIYDGLAGQFIRLWNCGLIAIPSPNGQGVDVLRHDADGARLEATYPTLREALRCAH